MCAGHLVYHGPREHVMEFFESLGFACPERKGVADFLQEVTSRKDQKVHSQLACFLISVSGAGKTTSIHAV